MNPSDNNNNSLKHPTPMEQVDELKYWLATAPANWDPDQNIQKFQLPTGECISCVLWNSLYHITGTDIVRSLVFRFQAFGRPVRNIKKFEEGVFSDLRNLKPGTDASLEEPKSEFLEMLYKNNCIRTQKKQKVFYWYSVPHDRLFLDALERDLKREKLNAEQTTVAIAEPALSFSFDSTQSLYDQFTKGCFSLFQSVQTCEIPKPQMYPTPELEYHTIENAFEASTTASASPECFNSPWSTSSIDDQYIDDSRHSSPDHLDASILQAIVPSSTVATPSPFNNNPNVTVATAANLFGMFSIFEGSPTYKQRRRRANSCTNMNNEHCNNSDDNLSQQQHRSNNANCPYPMKTYSCPFQSCGRLFKRLEHLKRHVRTHTMERPYSCSVCGKRFSRSDNLAQHRKTHERSSSNSPPPLDDSSNASDVEYEKSVINECYTYDSPNIPSCVPDGLAVYTTADNSSYPIFSIHPNSYLTNNTGNEILI